VTGDGPRRSSTSIPRKARVGRRRTSDDVVVSTPGAPTTVEEPLRKIPPSPGDARGEDSFEWSYRWQDSLNAVADETMNPGLCDRIIGSLVISAAIEGAAPLICVRGELGIGKSTLRDILIARLNTSVGGTIDGVHVRGDPRLYRILEAGDLESPIEFANRINKENHSHPLVALARPGTLDAAAASLERSPSAIVTILPFRSSTPVLFNKCIQIVADKFELGEEAISALKRRSRDLPEFLQTPFYFGVIAKALATLPSRSIRQYTPLELLATAIEVGLPSTEAADLLAIAMNPGRKGTHGVVVQGIVGREGFLHDGYRNGVLALGVLRGQISIDDLARCSNSRPALKLLLEHVRESPVSDVAGMIEELEKFAVTIDGREAIRSLLFLQAEIADTLSNISPPRNTAREVVRSNCLRLIRERAGQATLGLQCPSLARFSGSEFWWDISDSLSLLGDPRLEQAENDRFGSSSGYFTYIEVQHVKIGSGEIPERLDNAKPVLPYAEVEVPIGPLWVGNYLVTNEQFRAFWQDRNRDEYFFAAGAKWADGDADLLSAIEASFDVIAPRCFWKELQEQKASQVGERKSVLEITRERALRRGRVALWDPSLSDERYSLPGKPVVGVTWWEALAYCRWWEANVLPDSDLPEGAVVSLLTDWEWEGIRRIFYEVEATAAAKELIDAHEFPAHLRLPNARRSRRNTLPRVMQTLHVGLFPSPAGSGPLDMVGNVWEWTRSRVFGRIATTDNGSTDATFGVTRWDDVDAESERNPTALGRDEIACGDELAYRAVRGASWFSIDHNAAWNPAYRLCDPPYNSYWDLGFRIAVYPNGLPQ